MKLFLLVSIVLGLISCSSPTKTNVSPESAKPSEVPPPPKTTQLSQKAEKLRMGMSLKEVIALLGREPDTVHAAEVGNGLPALTTFEWDNSKNCQPVTVDFSSDKKAKGWNQGQTCVSESSYNKPIGKPCKGNKLCKP